MGNDHLHALYAPTKIAQIGWGHGDNFCVWKKMAIIFVVYFRENKKKTSHFDPSLFFVQFGQIHNFDPTAVFCRL